MLHEQEESEAGSDITLLPRLCPFRVYPSLFSPVINGAGCNRLETTLFRDEAILDETIGIIKRGYVWMAREGNGGTRLPVPYWRRGCFD